MSVTAKPVKDIDLGAVEFADVCKDGKIYSVKFASKLRVQSPVVVCTAPITNDKGEVLPYAYIKPDKELAKFLQDFDEFVLSEAHKRKDTWFRGHTSKRDIDDSFKPYFKDDIMRLKIGDDIEVFSTSRQPLAPQDLAAGSSVKVIMELSKVSFGRQSFGTVWRCPQVMLQRSHECLFLDDSGGEEDDDDEFL